MTQILFHSDPDKPSGEPYINLASAWCVYPAMPTELPLTESEVPAPITTEDEYQLIISLRDKTVVDIEVCHPAPHLVVTFDDRSVLYVNGHNEKYEAWQAGLSFSQNETWLVVACPCDSLAIWAPEHF
jgi:hypothetical protein